MKGDPETTDDAIDSDSYLCWYMCIRRQCKGSQVFRELEVIYTILSYILARSISEASLFTPQQYPQNLSFADTRFDIDCAYEYHLSLGS